MTKLPLNFTFSGFGNRAASDNAGGKRAAAPKRPAAKKTRPRTSADTDPDAHRDLFALTAPDAAPALGAESDQRVNQELTIRGTRAAEGTVGHPLVFDQGKGPADTTGKVTAYNLQAQLPVGAHANANVTLDRSSLTGGAVLPTGHDGGTLSVGAGLLTNLGMVSLKADDGHGTSVGASGLLSAHGQPAVGLTLSHATAAGGLAVSPSGLIDTSQQATVVRTARGNDGALQATVQHVRQTHAAVQLALSAGGAGVAGTLRAHAATVTEKRFTQVVKVEDARKTTRAQNALRQRMAALGRKRGAIPDVDAPQKLAEGESLEQTRGRTWGASAGLSVGGVQLSGGVNRSKYTKASVTRAAGDPQGKTAEARRASYAVALSRQQARTQLFAVDLPLAGAFAAGRATSEQQRLTYAVASDDHAAVRRLVRRKKNRSGNNDHFVAGPRLTLADVATPEAAEAKRAALKASDVTLRALALQRAEGGSFVRAQALPLLSSLFGARAGLSIERERARHVTQVHADATSSTVTVGDHFSLHVELPGIGAKGRSSALLKVDANAAGSAPVQHDVVQLTYSYSHAGDKTLADVQALLEDVTPNVAPGALPQDAGLAQAIDLEVEIRALVPPAMAYALAKNVLALPNVVDPRGDVAAQDALHDRVLASLRRRLASGDEAFAKRLVAALSAQGGNVQVQSRSGAFDALAARAAQLQVKVLGAQDPPRKALQLLPEMGQLTRELQAAVALTQAGPLSLVDATQQRARRGALERVKTDLQHFMLGAPTTGAEAHARRKLRRTALLRGDAGQAEAMWSIDQLIGLTVPDA